MKKLSLLLVFLILASLVPVRIAAAGAATEGRAECVVEVTSRRFLHEKNAEMRLPMASTTKILTAILILEDCDREEMAVVPPEAERNTGA